MRSRTEVLHMVSEERDRQNNKWGYPQSNSPFEWVSIIGEEFGKLSMAVNDAYLGEVPSYDTDAIKEYAVRVAAVAVALVEHF